MTKNKINRAIKHLGLTIEGARGDGCFYFIDADGDQNGETIYVCYLNQQTLENWVKDAEEAVGLDCMGETLVKHDPNEEIKSIKLYRKVSQGFDRLLLTL